VQIETSSPLFFDEYNCNRETGGFILIDPATNRTVAAGMIRGQVKSYRAPEKAFAEEISSNVTWEQRTITRGMREERNGHTAGCLWLTGLSGSGKTTIAKKLEEELFAAGKQVYLLDGDNVRHGLNGDLGFSEKERRENIRRVGHVARLMYDAGFIVVCSFISPRLHARAATKSRPGPAARCAMRSRPCSRKAPSKRSMCSATWRSANSATPRACTKKPPPAR
jgi:bifunctional enzyme CysN/CysC